MTATTQQTVLRKDAANKKVFVTREFAGSRQQVWDYWTKSELLDQWWAPKPWKAITKTQNFTEGGYWLYCMAGPEGEKHWARIDYKKINAPVSYSAQDSFCDEDGNKIGTLPSMSWMNTFHETETGTRVEVEITFEKEEDIKAILDMGFQEGFAMAHGNLDELLKN